MSAKEERANKESGKNKSTDTLRVFVPQEDILLTNGTLVRAGTEYFAYHTAKALINEGKTPAGWRMITRKDAQFFAFMRDSIEYPVGYINPNDMLVYRETVRKELALCEDKWLCWTDNVKNEFYTYALIYRPYGKHSCENCYFKAMYVSHGLPLLLTKDS